MIFSDNKISDLHSSKIAIHLYSGVDVGLGGV